MAYRLKNRQMQIPNGLKFLQPETNWQPSRNASFAVIVAALTLHRLGRPDLVAKHKWRTDDEGVAAEVEQFNVNLCLRHGWLSYLDGAEGGGGPPPKSRPPSPEEIQQVSVAAGKAKKIWAGIRTLNDWIDSGEPPVTSGNSELRAAVCSTCSHNTAGDFTSWFTAPAAGAIKKQIEKLEGRKLTTSFDAKLNVCDICLCPLKLKVHTPLSYIKAHMSDDILQDLMAVKHCWIPKELGV